MQSLTERMLLCAARLNPHIAVEVEKFVPEVRQLETQNAELALKVQQLEAFKSVFDRTGLIISEDTYKIALEIMQETT